MSLTINELVLHEAVLDESELENLSSSFQTKKDTKQLVKRFQAKATVTPLLSKPETLPADLCVVLNDQYPEMVTADPIRDCELLKKYQTKKIVIRFIGNTDRFELAALKKYRNRPALSKQSAQ